MEVLREYALLVAVAVPVLVIAGLQVYLFLAGERGTLLLPSLAPFESIAIEASQPEAVVEELPPRTVFAANSDHDDPVERIAA